MIKGTSDIELLINIHGITDSMAISSENHNDKTSARFYRGISKKVAERLGQLNIHIAPPAPAPTTFKVLYWAHFSKVVTVQASSLEEAKKKVSEMADAGEIEFTACNRYNSGVEEC